MKAEEMAKLFDVIEVESSEESSDYNTTADADVSLRSFESRCEDVQELMEDETETETVNEHHELIAAALEKAENKPKVAEPTDIADIDTESDDLDDLDDLDEIGDLDETGEQYADEVSRDMKEFEVEDDGEIDGEEESAPAKASSPVSKPKPEPEPEPEPKPQPQPQTKKPEPQVVPKAEPKPKKAEEIDPFDVESDTVFQTVPKAASDNPLGLHGFDLKFYKECLQQYPQFTLYDGSVAFKEFYRHKVEMLKQVLGRYPVLDVDDIEKELSNINIDHFVGNDLVITPEVLRHKLDESYKWRARLTSLTMKVIPQCYMWERWSDMLKSKLWKDHELKGAHRRDGLTMEHMSDIVDYAGALKGLMDCCKHVDMVLKAASDSLSRQLSCIQLERESLGTTQEGEERMQQQRQWASRKAPVDDLDSFDSIGVGEKISAPKSQGVTAFSYGVEADDLAMLG